MASKTVKTWEDGHYKFPYLKFNLYRAVNCADDKIMCGAGINTACEKAAEKFPGTSADDIKEVIADAYERHTATYGGLREVVARSEKAAEESKKAAEDVQKTVRRTVRFKKLVGHEEEVMCYHELGATNAMLARTFDTSPSQISKFISEQKEVTQA